MFFSYVHVFASSSRKRQGFKKINFQVSQADYERAALQDLLMSRCYKVIRLAFSHAALTYVGALLYAPDKASIGDVGNTIAE